MLDLEKLKPEDFKLGDSGSGSQASAPGQADQGKVPDQAGAQAGKDGADAGKTGENSQKTDNNGTGGAGTGSDKGADSAAASGTGSAQSQSASTTDGDGDDLAAFDDLTQETGVQIRSNDDIVASLKELAELRKGNIPGISPALKRALEIERQGGQATDFFKVLAFDPDAHAEKEVLRQRFLEKSQTAKSNIKLAGMEFDREFDGKYGRYLAYQSIKDDAEKKEFYEKHSAEIDFQQEKYKYDVDLAKKELKDLRENFPTTAQHGMTQKQIDELIEKHNVESVAAFAKFKTVDIPIEGDEVYRIGLNGRTKPIVEKWIKNPEGFLSAIGIHDDKFDYKQLLNVMAVVAEFSDPEFGKRFKAQVLDNKDAHTLENQLDGAGVDRSKRGQTDTGKKDIWDQVGEAAEEARKKNQR